MCLCITPTGQPLIGWELQKWVIADTSALIIYRCGEEVSKAAPMTNKRSVFSGIECTRLSRAGAWLQRLVEMKIYDFWSEHISHLYAS